MPELEGFWLLEIELVTQLCENPVNTLIDRHIPNQSNRHPISRIGAHISVPLPPHINPIIDPLCSRPRPFPCPNLKPLLPCIFLLSLDHFLTQALTARIKEQYRGYFVVQQVREECGEVLCVVGYVCQAVLGRRG